MIGDRDIWTVAQVMLRKRGMLAPDEVERCVAEFEETGDAPGLATWRRIGAALERWRIAKPAPDGAVH